MLNGQYRSTGQSWDRAVLEPVYFKTSIETSSILRPANHEISLETS